MSELVACIQPDQVNKADYLAALNHDSRPEFERHLAQCEFCRGEIQVCLYLDNKLRRHFEFISSPARTLCPEAQEVGEFSAGLMSPVESIKMRQHLTQCAWCNAESEQIRQWLLLPDAWLIEPSKYPPDRPNHLAGESFDRLRRVIATLLKPDNSNPSYVRAGIRGSDEDVALIFQAEEVTIILTVQAVGPRSEALNIMGLVQAEDTSLDELVGKEVRLLYQGQEFASDVLDELGNFIFEDVQPPQPFELEIGLETKIVTVPDLKLN